jgi:hypothetical protein
MRLPGEGLLAEVDVPLSLAVTDRAAKLIGQATSAACSDTGSADTFLHLLVDESLDVGSAREHLDARGRRVDLLGATWTSDEEQNLQDLTTTWHGKNLCHPSADPLEVLRRLDDPHKCEATSSNSAVCVTSNNITDVGNLVRNTDTSSPKHHCTVGAKVLTTYK